MTALRAGSTVYDNPHYHLEAFGLSNEMVQECIRLGAYNPGPCCVCRGTGKAVGERWATWQTSLEKHETPEPICRECKGTGLHDGSDGRIYIEDFGDHESQRVAERAFDVEYEATQHMPEPVSAHEAEAMTTKFISVPCVVCSTPFWRPEHDHNAARTCGGRCAVTLRERNRQLRLKTRAEIGKGSRA